MFLFFSGENTYLLWRKVRELENKARSNPNAEVVKIDGVALTAALFDQAVFTVSLFSTSRLVEIINLGQNKDTEIAKSIITKLDKIPKETVVLFIEEGLPDRRTVYYKALHIPKHSQDFLPLAPNQLSAWIKSEFAARGGKIDSPAVEALVALGNNMWRLDNEVAKLILYQQSQSLPAISIKEVRELVAAAEDAEYFPLIDALVAKNLGSSLKIINGLIANGENEIKILGFLTNQFRNLLLLASLQRQKVVASDLPAKAGMHPYAVKKSLAALRHYQQEQLEKIFQRFYRCDVAIKRGESEPNLLLNRLVVDICGE